MIAKTPAPPVPVATATPLPPIQYSTAERRFLCRTLQLHRFCSLARCRRMRTCHGEPQRCLATHGAAVPRAACVAAEAMLAAARYESLHEGDGEQWFKETCRGEAAVFDCFVAALQARDLRREGYALKARLRRMSKRALNRD